MTPAIDLRENSLQHVRDATKLLDTSHKNACSLASLGVEMMIKARLCRRFGWEGYPDTHREAELAVRGSELPKGTKLLVHDIDGLMTINPEISIKTKQFVKVDWPKVSGWRIENRYKSNAIISFDDASARVKESVRVVETLYRFEVLDSLTDIECELTIQFGYFSLFALLNNINAGSSESLLYLSAPMSSKEHHEAWVNGCSARLRLLDKDLRVFNSWHFPQINSEIVNVCSTYGIGRGSVTYVAGNVVVGSECIPEGYIFTSANWSSEKILEGWKNATAFQYISN